MKKKHVNVVFPNIKNLGERDWGKEDLLALIPGLLSLKRIEIKKGSKGGLQYHHKKNECGYLVSGNLIIRYDKGNGKLKEKILKPGDSFHFPVVWVEMVGYWQPSLQIQSFRCFHDDEVRNDEVKNDGDSSAHVVSSSRDDL